jgi:hypothetical protein
MIHRVARWLMLALVATCCGGEDTASEARGNEAVREVLKGTGLRSALQKLAGRDGADATVAPVLFIGGPDPDSRALAPQLLEFVDEDAKQSLVSLIGVDPFGFGTDWPLTSGV